MAGGVSLRTITVLVRVQPWVFMELWEILVPCKFEDNQKPVRTRHHRIWDAHVRKVAGGLTIFRPVIGQWVFGGATHTDRVIPVRIACTEQQIREIIQFTIRHYRQIAVMAYRLSDKVIVEYGHKGA